MVFVDFDRINADKFYDQVDENGVDTRLPPSKLHRSFEYKPSGLNEALVKLQQRATLSYTKLGHDLMAATNLYLSIKHTAADLQERITTDMPRIVPELSSVGAMATLAYLRHPQRSVLARLGLATLFTLGTTILVFPELRSRLIAKGFDSLPPEVQSGLGGLRRHCQGFVVDPLVAGWNATEHSFDHLKETLFK